VTEAAVRMGINRLGYEAVQSATCSAEVKYAWCNTSTPIYALHEDNCSMSLRV